MVIAQDAKDELKRSPLTIVLAVIGLVVNALALLVAWLQYAGAPAGAASQPSPVPTKLHVSNLLVRAAFFIAASISLALSIRLVARSHWFTALFLSAPAAVLAGFGSMVMLNLVPPRVLNAESLAASLDVVFYGVSLIFIAVNGLPLMRNLASSADNKESESERSGSAIGVVGLSGILLFFWCATVNAGIGKLVRAFLA